MLNGTMDQEEVGRCILVPSPPGWKGIGIWKWEFGAGNNNNKFQGGNGTSCKLVTFGHLSLSALQLKWGRARLALLFVASGTRRQGFCGTKRALEQANPTKITWLGAVFWRTIKREFRC
jgi:hypothetical protein